MPAGLSLCLAELAVIGAGPCHCSRPTTDCGRAWGTGFEHRTRQPRTYHPGSAHGLRLRIRSCEGLRPSEPVALIPFRRSPRAIWRARRWFRPRRARSCLRSRPARCSCARGRTATFAPRRASGEGLYARDTRHLSELRLTVGGLAPVLLSSSMQSGHHAVINATNPTLRSGEVEVPQETLNVRRTVLIADRLYYRVRVRSFRPEHGRDDGRACARRGLRRRVRGPGGRSAGRAVACWRRRATVIGCASPTSARTASSVRRSSS